MGKFISFVLINLLFLAGCAGANSMNTSASWEDQPNRPNVLYQGTGVPDPDSEL